MADLAEAIVELGKAAQARKGARRDLMAATAVVAGAIRRQLRRGDSTEVGEAPSTAVYGVDRVYDGHGALCQVLIRESGKYPDGTAWAVLEDIDVDGDDPRRLTSPDGIDVRVFHRATADECLLFAREAEALVAAFTAELREDTDTLAAAASRLAKLAVR